MTEDLARGWHDRAPRVARQWERSDWVPMHTRQSGLEGGMCGAVAPAVAANALDGGAIELNRNLYQ
jgi:hypothetical protein